jgi:hypothetical protein
VFLALDDAYLKKVKGQPKTKLLVPRLFHDSFLADNKAYVDSNTSTGLLANNPATNPPEPPN